MAELATWTTLVGWYQERVIVRAFLAALEPWAVVAEVSRQFARALRRCRGPQSLLRKRFEYLFGRPPQQDVNPDVQERRKYHAVAV